MSSTSKISVREITQFTKPGRHVCRRLRETGGNVSQTLVLVRKKYDISRAAVAKIADQLNIKVSRSHLRDGSNDEESFHGFQ